MKIGSAKVLSPATLTRLDLELQCILNLSSPVQQFGLCWCYNLAGLDQTSTTIKVKNIKIQHTFETKQSDSKAPLSLDVFFIDILQVFYSSFMISKGTFTCILHYFNIKSQLSLCFFFPPPKYNFSQMEKRLECVTG